MDKLIVGMADSDTRRHYYDTSQGYAIRYCTWAYVASDNDHLVVMKDIPVDCKNCIKKFKGESK
jgi:hemolysin-activating ACP:hemolysin acyltransferase